MSAVEVIDLDDDVIIETAPPSKPAPSSNSTNPSSANATTTTSSSSSSTATSTAPVSAAPPKVSAAVAALSPENRELYDRISAQFAQDGTRKL